jgi:hypothetical protein
VVLVGLKAGSFSSCAVIVVASAIMSASVVSIFMEMVLQCVNVINVNIVLCQNTKLPLSASLNANVMHEVLTPVPQLFDDRDR